MLLYSLYTCKVYMLMNTYMLFFNTVYSIITMYIYYPNTATLLPGDQVEVIATTILRSSSGTSWTLRNIYFSKWQWYFTLLCRCFFPLNTRLLSDLSIIVTWWTSYKKQEPFVSTWVCPRLIVGVRVFCDVYFVCLSSICVFLTICLHLWIFHSWLLLIVL